MLSVVRGCWLRARWAFRPWPKCIRRRDRTRARGAIASTRFLSYGPSRDGVVRRWKMASAFYGQAALVMPEEYREGYVDVVNGADTERFQPGPPASNDGPLRCVYLSSFRA